MSVKITSKSLVSTSIESSLTYGGMTTSGSSTSSSSTLSISDITGLQTALDAKLGDNLTSPIGTNITALGNDVNLLTGLAAYGLTTADLQKLADVNSATATEIDYLSGVTSNVQTQLDSKIGNDFTASDQIHVSTGANTYIAASMADVLSGAVGVGYSINNLKAPTANYDFGTYRITGLADPVNTQDAATKNYVDVSIASGLAGGVTMTGTLDLDGNNLIMDTSGSTYFNNSVDTQTTLVANGTNFTFKSNELDAGGAVISNLSDPSNLQDAATKNYVDTTFVPLSGGTMTGNLSTSGTAIFIGKEQTTSPTYAFSGDVTTGMGLSATGMLDLYSSGTSVITLQSSAGTLASTIFNTTDAIMLPSGTTAQRPSTPAAGYMRYNTTTSSYEGYDGTNWVSFSPSSGALVASNNLSDLASVSAAITNLGLDSGGTNDIWVNVAGDTMTGDLTMSGSSVILNGSTVPSLVFTGDTTTGLGWNSAGSFDVYSSGSVVSTFSGDGTSNLGLNINTTNGLKIPVGTTAQRPSVPIEGTIRYNSNTNFYEGYNSGSWQSFAPVDLSVFPFTPAGNISATTALGAITELDTEKLAIDGSMAMTGSLDMGNNTITNIAAPFTVSNMSVLTNAITSTVVGNTAYVSMQTPSSSVPTYSYTSDNTSGTWFDGTGIRTTIAGTDELVVDSTSIDVVSKRITNVADPTAITDAVNVNYLVGNGFEHVLGTTTGIDLTVAGSTAIYTVPATESHIITKVILVATSYTPGASPVDPAVSISNGAAGDVMATVTATWGGTSGAAGQASYLVPDNGAQLPTAGSTVSLTVDTGASGTFSSLVVSAYVLGIVL